MAILTELQEEQEEAITTTYDVFLSFRGEGTSLRFIDHLYQALVNENICTFLDEEVDQRTYRNCGFEKKRCNSRREMVVIEEVVKEINTRLELHLQRRIAHLIRMDDSIYTISSWLKGGSC